MKGLKSFRRFFLKWKNLCELELLLLQRKSRTLIGLSLTRKSLITSCPLVRFIIKSINPMQEIWRHRVSLIPKEYIFFSTVPKVYNSELYTFTFRVLSLSKLISRFWFKNWVTECLHAYFLFKIAQNLLSIEVVIQTRLT